MISAHHLIFNGFSTEDFDVIPHWSFSSDDGATPSYLSAEGVYTEHYDGHRTIHRAKYNEAFTPRFTLIKKDESDFDAAENRKILSWLTASTKPGFLEVYQDDSNVLEWRAFGCVTSVEQYKLGNGRIVGYEFEMESTHPYAWSRKFTYPEVYETIKELSNNDETNDYLTVSKEAIFTIPCNTDEYNKLLYPKVTIVFPSQRLYFSTNVDPTKDNSMIPNVIYSWTDKEENTHLYINLNGEEDVGKYEIQELSGDAPDITTTNISAYQDYKYYYFPDDGGYIRKLKVQEDGATVKWFTVTKVGMAAKISNTYTFEGETKTTESIITGGAIDEEIILDGTNKVISGVKGTSTRIIGDDFNWNWMPLAYGDNNITVMGNCKIKIEWLEPRKVGSL